MPYFTKIPDATIDLEAETPVLGLGNNLLLNELSGSTPFTQYALGGEPPPPPRITHCP